MAGLRSTLALILALVACRAHGQAQDNSVVGLWTYETSFHTAVHGDFKIARIRDRWTATLAGREAVPTLQGTTLTVDFPDQGGRFRGTLRADASAIDGFWIRPPVVADPRYPGGVTQSFATPLVLKAARKNQWQGTVHTLPDPFRLYLKVFRDEKGQLLAAFRDPDQNGNGGASRFLVVVEGDRLRFQQPNESGGFDTAFSAARVGDGKRLKLDWQDLGGRSIELQRRTPAQVPAFFPRPPGGPAYAYHVPEAINDGWPVARGRDVGFDESAMARAVQGIIDGDPAARAPSLIHSLLVARNGKLVLEEYFFGYDRDTPHDLRSAGKTFSSILLGAAMRKGVDLSPQSKIIEVLADRGPFANPDPRKATITLAQLMTHSAGLACNDNDDASPGNENTMQTQTAQQDWWKYTLDLPMAHDPGARYAYCSANINLVGGALATGTGTWLPEFFDRTVARPLGFGEYHWNLTPTGDGYLGGGAWLRPRDLLKVGQAYLDGGVWRGQRIVDADWIATSTASRIAVTPQTTGYSEEDFGNYYGRGEDAYAWHLGQLNVGEHRYRTYAATGNGGQLLVVVPELDMTAVFTGGNYRQGGIWGKWPQRIVGEQIVAAIVKEKP